MWVAFKHTPVHKGARVTFIAVTNHKFARARRFRHRAPFKARGIAGAAATSQPTFDNGIDDLRRLQFRHHMLQGQITSRFDIVFDSFRIDATTIGTHNQGLTAKERMFRITQLSLSAASTETLHYGGGVLGGNMLVK